MAHLTPLLGFLCYIQPIADMDRARQARRPWRLMGQRGQQQLPGLRPQFFNNIISINSGSGSVSSSCSISGCGNIPRQVPPPSMDLLSSALSKHLLARPAAQAALEQLVASEAR